MSSIDTQFKKGHIGFKGMLGKKHSEETKALWSKTRKGRIPWNKGLKGVQSHSPETRKKMSEQRLGDKSLFWKGENATYDAKHRRVYTKKGNPDTCEKCGQTGLTGHQIQWANKDHEYRDSPEDWMRLCAKCHFEYDVAHGFRPQSWNRYSLPNRKQNYAIS